MYYIDLDILSKHMKLYDHWKRKVRLITEYLIELSTGALREDALYTHHEIRNNRIRMEINLKKRMERLLSKSIKKA